MNFWSRLFSTENQKVRSSKSDVQNTSSSGVEISESRIDPAWKVISEDPEKFKSAFKTSAMPICPYCNSNIEGRKPQKQRSKFKCPKCSLQIWVDPYTKIFPSIYLKDRQGLIAKYLDILDVGKMRLGAEGTVGTTEDFWYSADQIDWTKDKRKLTDDEAGDVLWRLFNYNMEYFRYFLSSSEARPPQDYVEYLKGLMEEYGAQEKELRKQKGKIIPRKKSTLSSEDPKERLQNSLNNLPMPASFRGAYVPLRQIIREKKNAGEGYEEELGLLYTLLAQCDFLLATPYIEDIGPGFNVAESIPRETWESLPMPFERIGYNKLKANKTDIKWFVEAWGEPAYHVSAQDYHIDVWEAAVARYPKYHEASMAAIYEAAGLR